MPKTDLTGKTIVVSTGDKFYSQLFVEDLEKAGAKIHFTEKSPHHPDNVPDIVAEINRINPDAVVIHEANLDTNSGPEAANKLLAQLADRPTVLVDAADRTEFNKLENRGAARYVAVTGGPDVPERALHEVGDAIADKQKEGRKR